MNRYVTKAQAEELTRQALAAFEVLQGPAFATLNRAGLIGTSEGDDYYVVPDDDPRLQSKDQVCDTESVIARLGIPPDPARVEGVTVLEP